jgi:hypothetical protein
MQAITRLTASLLLHGDARDKRVALDAAERLAARDVSTLAPLQPALKVFQKMSSAERLQRRARRCLEYLQPVEPVASASIGAAIR